MAASAGNIACFALLLSILALQVPSCIDQRGGSSSAGTTTTTTAASNAGTASASASTSAPPPLDDGALKAAMVALAGMDALLIAAAVIYSRRHTHHAGGGSNWRVSELAFFVLCLQVSVLQFVLFVQQPAAAGGAAACALGASAAAHALPCVASVTFFLGTTLVYAHVGNAAGGAIAGNGPVPAPATATVRLLANMTLGAALACLRSIILAWFYINTK